MSCTCGKPTRDQRTLCDDCIEQLARSLGNVPAVIAELDITLSRQRRFTDEHSNSDGDALPYNLAASRARTRLTDALSSVATRLSVTLHHAQPANLTGDNLAALSAYLLRQLNQLVTQPWAADALNITRVVDHCINVIDRPPARIYAGPCDTCGHDLYARSGKRDVTCYDCGLVYDLAARREWLLSVVEDQLATAVEIARALTTLELPVTAERIRQWKHRERIEARARDRLGRPLYRVGDIIELVVEHAQRIA